MKTAKISRLRVVELACPFCGEALDGPSGSQLILEAEWKDLPPEFRCGACGSACGRPRDPFLPRASKR